jgi:hypothetical protein
LTGFLVKLLARSRGAADVVTPRIASLFEPPGPSLPAPEWEVVAGPEPDAASAPNRTAAGSRAPAPGSRAQAEASRPPGRIQAQPERIPAEHETDVDEPRPTVLSPPVPAAGPAPAARLTQLPGRPGSAPGRVPEAAGVTAATPVDRGARDVAADVPAARATGRQAPQDGFAGREPSFSEVGPEAPALRPSEIADQPLPVPRPPAPPLLLPPRRRPRFEAARREQPAASSVPAVHVTIGRIEVRAVTDPAPTRRERAESPVMSLADYLKSRAGRDRP